MQCECFPVHVLESFQRCDQQLDPVADGCCLGVCVATSHLPTASQTQLSQVRYS